MLVSASRYKAQLPKFWRLPGPTVATPGAEWSLPKFSFHIIVHIQCSYSLIPYVSDLHVISEVYYHVCLAAHQKPEGNTVPQRSPVGCPRLGDQRLEAGALADVEAEQDDVTFVGGQVPGEEVIRAHLLQPI